jgi:excisionase family DNA binding protein
MIPMLFIRSKYDTDQANPAGLKPGDHHLLVACGSTALPPLVMPMNDKSDTKRLAEAVANIAITITEIIDSKMRELAQAASSSGPASFRINRFPAAEGWVSLQETAEHLKISRRTMYDWMKRGFVPHIRIGRGIRFKLSEVDEAMKRRLGVEARY